MLKTIKLILIASFLLITFSQPAHGTAASGVPTLKFYLGFHDLGDFHDGLAPVKNEYEKLGYIDLAGNLVIDYLFDTQRTDWELDGDFAWSGSWHPVERMFDPRVNNNYLPNDYAFDRGYAYVMKDGKGIYIDCVGNEYLNPFPDKYYFVAPFFKGRAVAQKEKDGLFGYIDESGTAITDFEFLCASHFNGGVAMAIAAVPYKNGTSRYIPDYLSPYVTNEDIDKTCPIRKKNIPDGMDIIDVYLDTSGNVLSWGFHDAEKLDNNFRAGIIIDMKNVSEGIILRNAYNEYGENTFWYELADGTVSFELDRSLNIAWAEPFLPEKIAPVNYTADDGRIITGYIDNTGRFLDEDEIKDRFPNMSKRIEWVMLDENGKGYDTDIATVDGERYLVKVTDYRNRDNTGVVDSENVRSVFLLVDGDRILYDCTEQMLDGLAQIFSDYWPYTTSKADIIENISKSDPYLLGINIYKTDLNSNIYYVDKRISMREFDRIGYIVVE